MSLKHQEAIVKVLSRMNDQNEKFRYLVDLGRSAPDYPEEFRNEDFIVKGCISQLWLHPNLEEGKVRFDIDSDAAIPKGIAAILAKVYNGCTPEEILNHDPAFLTEVGIEQHLSMNRRNGLSNLIKQIRLYAMAYKTIAEQKD